MIQVNQISSKGGPAALTREAAAEIGGIVREVREKVGSRRYKSGAPVRRSFVVRAAPDAPPPPLAALLRGGGRGGQTRLKIYLSLIWLSAAEPYTTEFAARGLAGLIGLEDPEEHGRRRVQSAVRSLAERGLVATQQRRGTSPRIRLLSDAGTGEKYQSPSVVYNRLSVAGAPESELREQRYFKIPSEAWAGGYIARMSGAGVAMMLVLLAEQGLSSGKNEVWFSPRLADERYALAPATRTKGLAELRALGLVEVRQRAVSEMGNYLDVQRWRNVYSLAFNRET